MSIPLKELLPALEVLANGLEILPAMGGAVEDLQHPDADEIDDLLVNRDVGRVTAFHEDPEPSTASLYRPTPPLPRSERHLFRYFIDGSLRTYYLATGIEGQRTFPIELAQVGSAAVTRDERGRLSILKDDHRMLLLIPSGGRGLSDTVWTQLNRVATESLEVVNTVEKDVLSGDANGDIDLRNKAGGKARYVMHRMEIDLVQGTDGSRDENNWLILDGAVKLGEFVNAPFLIGVAKSFRKDPQFQFSSRSSERRDVTSILAGLPYAHRTVAFYSYDGQVAFWYVRMWEQKNVDYPLMGVVKVELPRPDRTPVPSEQADLLSRALVAERSVTPYGLDRRWHCHLYPVYITEQCIKNRFYSRDVLMGAVRWPHPNGR